MTWLGLDIGGANLKAADGRGWARCVPFALWREPGNSPAALAALTSGAPAAEHWAVTMTGELCDAFRTKAIGVRQILNAVNEIAGGREVRVYLVDGRLVSLSEASEAPQLAAASNWHALARFACRYTLGAPGLLIDIGSTTTDIVPLVDGKPCPRGLNDTDRLVARELLYRGVGRTPVCAVTKWLPWGSKHCPVAAEFFATTADAYVLLGEIAEQAEASWTADSRPLTKEYARERLARMICSDATSFSERDAQRAARLIRETQADDLREALVTVMSTMPQPASFVLSGSGEFLARRVVAKMPGPGGPVISLAAELGEAASQAGPAHALAVLAQEWQ